MHIEGEGERAGRDWWKGVGVGHRMRMVILVGDHVFCGLVLNGSVLGSFIVVMCVVVLRRAGIL